MGVIINNQNTKNLGFALVGGPEDNASSDKKYEAIEVEGRDGAIKFIGYQDLKFSF